MDILLLYPDKHSSGNILDCGEINYYYPVAICAAFSFAGIPEPKIKEDNPRRKLKNFFHFNFNIIHFLKD